MRYLLPFTVVERTVSRAYEIACILSRVGGLGEGNTKHASFFSCYRRRGPSLRTP